MKTAPHPVRISSFGVAKGGNTDAEWEDAAAHSEGRGRFAVADGAAAAYRSGLWSHLLARGFVVDPVPVHDDAAIASWVARRGREWAEATKVGPDAPYYIRHAQRRGSHSTFLGVELDGGTAFSAIAVGDTCLLHVRRDRIEASFPVDDASAFGYQPDLLATDAERAPSFSRWHGSLAAGDMLLGVTDAVAEFLLSAEAAGDKSALTALRQAGSSIDDLVARARQSGSLRNDDVAVVRCLVHEGPGR